MDDFSTDGIHTFSLDLGSRFQNMSFKQILYFALAGIERAMPFYLHFARISGVSNVDELSTTLESYWGLSDYPEKSELKKAEIPPVWELSDQQAGFLSGEAINLFVAFLYNRDHRALQLLSDKLLFLNELLTMKIGKNYVSEEMNMQEIDISSAETLDEEDPVALNDYITNSIQIAYDYSNTILAQLN